MHHLNRLTVRTIAWLMGLYILLAVSHLSPYALQLNHSPIDTDCAGTDCIKAGCQMLNLSFHTADAAPLSTQSTCKQHYRNHYHGGYRHCHYPEHIHNIHPSGKIINT
jgi:hypothetical protein